MQRILSPPSIRAYLAGTTKVWGHAQHRTASRPGSQRGPTRTERRIALLARSPIGPLRAGTARGPVVRPRCARLRIWPAFSLPSQNLYLILTFSLNLPLSEWEGE